MNMEGIFCLQKLVDMHNNRCNVSDLYSKLGHAKFFQLLGECNDMEENDTLYRMLDQPRISRLLRACDDLETLYHVDYWLGLVTICVVAALGIVGNVFSMAVWLMETTFNATVFLFIYLAGWDAVYLAIVIAHGNIKRSPDLHNSVLMRVMYYSGNWVQLVAVHVTLLIAISRWIAVVFPLRSLRILTSRRNYLASGLILIYCFILEGAQIIFDAHHPMNTGVFAPKRVIGIGLPMLLLVGFNLSLLWTATRHPKELQEIEMRERAAETDNYSNRCARSSNTSETTEVVSEEGAPTELKTDKEIQQNSLEVQQTQKQLPPSQSLNRKQQQRSTANHQAIRHQHTNRRHPQRLHMVKAVLLVCLCSFITYPVGASLQLYVIERRMDLSAVTSKILISVAYLCQVVNSGINVLIYWFFVSRFRQLAETLRLCLCARLRLGPRMLPGNTTDSSKR